jgi:hypothetical protein
MRRLVLALASVTSLGVGVSPTNAQKTGTVVATCRTANGLWGNTNTWRTDILKFSVGDAVFRIQPFATANKEKWAVYPFPAGGGQFTMAGDYLYKIVVEGDGYLVGASRGTWSNRQHFASLLSG